MHAQEADVCDQAYKNLACELSAIHDPSREVASAARERNARVSGYLDAVIRSGIDSVRWMAQWKKGEPVVDGPWPRLQGGAVFGRELSTLAATLCILLDSRSARLRIEVTRQTTCPRFHVDNVPARLPCTWRGPGTEYLERRCAHRSRLGPNGGGLPDGRSGLIPDSACVHEIPTFTVAVLKGEWWPDTRSHGAIHRSPAMPPGASPRVMVAIDIP